MKDWKFHTSNLLENLCLVCSKSLTSSSFYICKKCKKVCNVKVVNKVGEGGYFLVEIKSTCCEADVENMQKTTCSEECHHQLVNNIELQFGKFKKVVDMTTNIEYRVPTKDIIEKGLNQDQLTIYPKWSENI